MQARIILCLPNSARPRSLPEDRSTRRSGEQLTWQRSARAPAYTTVATPPPPFPSSLPSFPSLLDVLLLPEGSRPPAHAVHRACWSCLDQLGRHSLEPEPAAQCTSARNKELLAESFLGSRLRQLHIDSITLEQEPLDLSYLQQNRSTSPDFLSVSVTASSTKDIIYDEACHISTTPQYPTTWNTLHHWLPCVRSHVQLGAIGRIYLSRGQCTTAARHMALRASTSRA